MVDLPDGEGISPLYMACFGGHAEAVRALIQAGAKVDLLATETGGSPLHVACTKGHTEVVCALLSGGATVDVLCTSDMTPLHLACQVGHVDVVHALLSAGAKVDMLTASGMTPLHITCQVGHIEVIRALLSAGGQAGLRDKSGMTPLDVVPPALRPEVELLVQRTKDESRGSAGGDERGSAGGEERGNASARADESRVGTPSAPAVVLPPPHYQSDSQLQAASEGGVEDSSEGPAGLSAEASSSGRRAASGNLCSLCGGTPSASASPGGVAKLKVCGRCMSVRYCSQECQTKHWGEGGHKKACPQLREKRERRKGCGAGD